MDIVPADLDNPQVRALLARHLWGMKASSPPGAVFALDLGGLRQPDIAAFAGWEGDELCCIGAIKALSSEHGELKSMRTADAHLRQGAGTAMLEHLISIARSRGYQRLSLETGSGPDFEPALTLYRKRGFQDGEAFADYAARAFNQFLHLQL